jgi:hypothetical protein
MLRAVTRCLTVVLEQQPNFAGHSRRGQHVTITDSSNSSSQVIQVMLQQCPASNSSCSAGSSSAAALQQQAVQLLAQWEWHIRLTAATGVYSLHDCSGDEGFYDLARMLAASKLPHSENYNTAVPTDYEPVPGPLVAFVLRQGTGPVTPGQLQLFHLLCSLLKLSRAPAGGPSDDRLLWAINPAQQALDQLLGATGRITPPARDPDCITGASTVTTGRVAAAGAAQPAAAAAAAAGGASTAGVGSGQPWSEGATAAAILWLRVLGLACLRFAAVHREHLPQAAAAGSSQAAQSDLDAWDVSYYMKRYKPCIGPYCHALRSAWSALNLKQQDNQSAA